MVHPASLLNCFLPGGSLSRRPNKSSILLSKGIGRAWMLLVLFAAGFPILSTYSETLGQALDATNLTWTTSGSGSSFGWSVTSFFPHDGASDATSGSVYNTAASTLQTSLTGPGTLTFWWKNPSYTCNLSFIAGTNTLDSFGGPYSTWQFATYYLGPGTQTFKWVYSVRSPPADSYAAYVDGVSYTPGATAPVINAQPLSQSQVRTLDATFRVTAGGTPPLGYQWRFDGTDIPGATSNSYTVSGIQSTDLGNYTVTVSNSVNWIVSSNASLEFGEVTAWGSPGFDATIVRPGATNVFGCSAGYYRNFLLKRDGSNISWGANLYGQAVLPADLTNAIALACGLFHTVALKDDGTVGCWGENTLGLTNVPANLSNVVAIAAGDFHSLALRADGTVAAWGESGAPTNVPPDLTNVVAVAGGGFLSLALTADGHVVEWSGQSAPPNVSNVVAIAAGGGHYMALTADGIVISWGQNGYGESSVPAGLSNVVAISAGEFHSIALRADGTVVAWGYNNSGITNVPPALTNVVAISAGGYHTLAQVGDGPPMPRAVITDLGWLSNVFRLSIPSQSGRVYQVQYKNSLDDANWTSLPLAAGNGTNLLLTDLTANGPCRFYRVLRW